MSYGQLRTIKRFWFAKKYIHFQNMDQVMNSLSSIRKKAPPAGIFVTNKGPNDPHGDHYYEDIGKDEMNEPDDSEPILVISFGS